MIIYLALGWVMGVALTRLVQWPLWFWGLLAGITFALLVWRWPNFKQRMWVAVLVGLALGAARAEIARPQFGAQSLPSYHGAGRVQLLGVVVSPPDERDTYTNLTILVTQARIPTGPAQTFTLVGPEYGHVLVRTSRFTEAWVGSQVEVLGWLEAPPQIENFNYADYLNRQGVYSMMGAESLTVLGSARCPTDIPQYGLIDCAGLVVQSLIGRARATYLGVINRIYPEPQASLLAGMLLGDETGIPRWLAEAYRTTGTTHMIAISGFNITLLATLVLRLSGPLLPQRWAKWLAVVVVAVYTLLAGADGSVVRASVMATLVLLAGGLARGGYRNGLYALSTAAILIILANPSWLWDVGFQLSVAATLGLIVYADPFGTAAANWLRDRLGAGAAQVFTRNLAEFTTVTLAAQLTTLPLIAFYFSEISIISLLANVLLLPLQPMFLGLGGLSMLAGAVWLPLGQGLALLNWPFAALTIEGIRVMAQVPGAVLPLPRFAWVGLLALYAMLAVITRVMQRPADKRPVWWQSVTRGFAPNTLLLGLVVLTLVVWQAVLNAPDGRLHVRYLAVGNGQATVLRTPNGNMILIDGGPSPAQLADGLGRWLPATQRVLDLVVLTDASATHVGGLVGLTERYTIRQVLLVATPENVRAYQEWMAELAEVGVPIWVAVRGEPTALLLDDAVHLQVLSQGAERTVVVVQYGAAQFMFAPNLTAARTPALLADVPNLAPVTVLLAPGQGEAGTLSAPFLQRVNPQAVLIAVGAGNADGAPALSTLNQLGGYNVLRTDQHGWIEATTDGENLWLQSER